MTATASPAGSSAGNDNVGDDAQALSALFDGEADAGWALASPARAPSALPELPALPITDAGIATWRGYCLTGSVLRGELHGAVIDTLDLANRIRHQIATDKELQAAFEVASTSAPARHRAWRRDSGTGTSMWARWQRAARARPRLGAAVALGAAAISVAIGVAGNRSGAPGQDGISVADVGAPILSTSAMLVSIDAPVALAAARVSAAVPTRAAVPHVEADGATVAHGQLPYFFAHASATNAGYQPSSMNLMPIAATDLAGGHAVVVRH